MFAAFFFFFLPSSLWKAQRQEQPKLRVLRGQQGGGHFGGETPRNNTTGPLLMAASPSQPQSQVRGEEEETQKWYQSVYGTPG